MNICLINPPLVSQRNDFLGSGIPYMPHGLAYLAAVLEKDHEINVIDSFGENPKNVFFYNEYVVQGIPISKTIAKILPNTDFIAIYANSVMACTFIEELAKKIKAKFPKIKLVVFENTQAVTGFSLFHILEKLFKADVDYVITGEAESAMPEIIKNVSNNQNSELSPGIWQKSNGEIKGSQSKDYIQNLDDLPFPAWHLLPVENYWKLGYAHGPLTTKKYLAQLTSRGCPFNCKFCVVPSTNNRKWRSRSPENVVKEIELYKNKFGVSEFHWEDLNSTTDEKRILKICELIKIKNLDIIWKLVSGTKIETLSDDTIIKMAKAGCDYISFSPESGSKKVLEKMGKPFNHEHALNLTRQMRKNGIFSQACFVIGFPGETDDDLIGTQNYIKKLVDAGIDEIAVFIMSPLPGSAVFDKFSGDYKDISQLTFSPEWRKDYNYLSNWRQKLYRTFLLRKSFKKSWRCAAQGFRFLQHKFMTKMEMTPYRILKMKSFIRNAK